MAGPGLLLPLHSSLHCRLPRLPRSTGLGLHWAQMQRLIESWDSSVSMPAGDDMALLGAGQILRHLGALLAASGAIHLAVLALSLRTRIT